MKEVWSFRCFTWRCVQYRVGYKMYLTENHLHRPIECSDVLFYIWLQGSVTPSLCSGTFSKFMPFVS